MSVKIERIEKIVYLILFGCITLFVFLTMSYDDGIINSKIGYELVEGLFGGNFGEVYNKMSFSYGLPIYLIYALWSIPVVLIDFIRGTRADIYIDRSVFLWYKGLLLVFFVLCCYWFYKIVIELIQDEAKSRLFTLLLASSSLMFFPPLAITQCDVMSLSFSLAGIYYLMKKNDIGFIAFFAIAITMKYLPLFIFIPLFLYRYKKAKQMVIVGISGVSVLLISVCLMSFSRVARQAVTHPAFFDATAQIRGFFEGSSLWLGIGNMSMVSAYFIAICLLAHFIEAKSEDQYKQWIPWITLASWYTLFIFWGANTYWYVLLAPFLILVIINRADSIEFGLFAEIALMNVMLLERVCSQGWVFGGGKTFTRLLLRDYVSSHSDLLKNLFDRVTYDYFSALKSVYISIIVVLSFTLLIRFIPRKEMHKEFATKPLKIALWVQLIILFIWCGLSLSEEIRLTKGIKYDIEELTFSEDVVVEAGAASLNPGDVQDMSYISLPAGGYRLMIMGDDITADCIDVQYDYNGVVPIKFNVVDEGDNFIQIEFKLESYVETLRFTVTNRTNKTIPFYGYRLNELK